MNHQIEDHVNVEATLGKGAKAVNLDEAGARHERQRGSHGRVEALGVSGGQQRASLRGGLHQHVGFRDTGRERLLDEDGRSGLDERKRSLNVRDRRRGDDHCVHASQERRRIGERRGSSLRGYLGSALRLRVDDGDEINLGHLRQNAGVVLAEVPDTDHRDTGSIHLSPRLARDAQQ